jgi:hypothetical protein
VLRQILGIATLALWSVGCTPPLIQALDDDDATGDDDTSADDDVTGDDDDSTGDDDTTSYDDPPPVINKDCPYTRVFEQDGPVLDVVDGSSSWSVEPLEPGEGFYCAVLRFTLTTPDNLEELVEDYTGCPEYLPIASFGGTAEYGQLLADAVFHPYDAGCSRGPDRLEMTNYMAAATGIQGPWPPGESWRVEVRVEPFFSRVTLRQAGQPVGDYAEATLTIGEDYASETDTRDPRFTIGFPAIEDDNRFPWYGATYSDLDIWLNVAAAPDPP